MGEELESYGDKVVIATKFGFDMINNKKEDYGGSFMCASWHLLYEDCVKIYKKEMEKEKWIKKN